MSEHPGSESFPWHGGTVWDDYARERNDNWLDHLAEHPPEKPWLGVYPGMCLDRELCRGKTHCPRDPSCCE